MQFQSLHYLSFKELRKFHVAHKKNLIKKSIALIM